MKLLLFFFSILNFFIASSQHRVVDTLVDVGGYNMHFYLIEGQGTPILFESGAGNDGLVWEALASNLHDVLNIFISK